MLDEDTEKVNNSESLSEPVDLLGFGTPSETPSGMNNTTEVNLLGIGTPSNSESGAANENPEPKAGSTSDLLGFEANTTDNAPLNNGLGSFQENSNGEKNTEEKNKVDEMILEPDKTASNKEKEGEKHPSQEEMKPHEQQQQQSMESKETSLVDSMNTLVTSENSTSEQRSERVENAGKNESIPGEICTEDGTETPELIDVTENGSRNKDIASHGTEEGRITEDTPVKVKDIVHYYEEFATETKRRSLGAPGSGSEESLNRAILEEGTLTKDEPSSNTDVGNAKALPSSPLNNDKELAEREKTLQPQAVEGDTPLVTIGELPPMESNDLPKANQQLDPVQNTRPEVVERNTSTATVVELPPPEEESSPELVGERPPADLKDSSKENKPHDSEQNLRPKLVERDTSTATVVELPPPEQESLTELANEESKVVPLETQALIIDLQGAVQEHLNGREAAIERATKAESRVKYLEEVLVSKKAVENELTEVKTLLESAKSDREHLLVELEKLRENRDEHERKQIVLSNRLNAAKKQEASKINHAEKLEDEIKVLDNRLQETTKKLETAEKSNTQVSEENSTMKKEYEGRIKKLESNLKEERRLNDERKKKMKVFVENKQEELRNSQAQNEEVNMELSQTNRSLREHHSRWKQLHAQWVQSQTRNRELQRDINRMKKESESMSRLGDKMNQKLSQSAQETEEHKNKRMNAKQELMTLLNTLESERDVSSKLRDSIKFTFTPKALSQQQILTESLRDFEDGLVRLSQRLGKPLPPRSDVPEESMNDNAEEDDESDPGSRQTRSEIDSSHLLTNLEGETQRVSQCIMAMSSNIERLHMMVSQNGERSCASVLSDLLAGATGVTEETTSMTRPRMTIGTSQNYGQVPTVNH